MNILITGANRGIGLGLVKAFSDKPYIKKIYGCCKNIDNMWQHEKIIPKSLDVTNSEDIKNLKAELKATPIDILINNAGIFGKREIDYSDMLKVFNVNALGALRISEALKENIAASDRKLMVGISSIAGSIASRKEGGTYGYYMSKAAMNMMLKNFQLHNPEIQVLILHPGWVQTDMGGERAPVNISDSVDGLIQVIETQKEFGFFDYQGKTLPW